MKRISSKIFVIISFLSGISFYMKSQDLAANDDNIKTGPLQKIRLDVTRNDAIPCDDYTLSIVSISPIGSGIALFDGDFLIFTPGANISDETVEIVYDISCPDGGNDEATVFVDVSTTNLPINIIQTDEVCIDNMPENVQFGIQRKFIAYSDESFNTTPSYKGGHLQAFQIPLVGDLNGDGKPEIIALGTFPNTTAAAGTNSATSTLATYVRRIYIFDGQTGTKIFSFELNSLGSGYGNFQLGVLPYHQSPAYMALADVDNDGLGEIILCQSTGDGKVYALKPTIDTNKKITGLIKMWDGEYGHKAPLNPTGSTTYQIYGQPIPNIVDMNGDGIPELVVHNKIYNAQTGKLLMAWSGTALTPTASSLTTGTGLATYNPATSETQNASRNETMSNTVKSRAMIGRRPSGAYSMDINYSEPYIAVPAIADIDGDGMMEIITGSRIHKFNFTYLGRENEMGSHLNNTYSTVDGPASATAPINSTGTSTATFYFNDGFTRVADIDGDGRLEAIVFQNATGRALQLNILVYVWDIESKELEAFSSFYSYGDHGTFGIPFIGDINGRKDGWDSNSGSYENTLPEICLIAGRIYLNRTTTEYSGRTGMAYHHLSNMSNARTGNNMIISMTYDGAEAKPEDRLKVSWVLEHEDYSNNTGITMFDFNNDNAFDLCYRDEYTLRVISPNLGSTDYIRLGSTTEPAILFRTNIISETGYEAPVIADVNLDGSADIIVSGYVSKGYFANIYAFEYASGGPMWAPCPPVWNQALYNPLHINEDLTVPAKPISMLTQFTGGSGEPITPYNGAWIQQPIVKEGGNYIPVYRHPDAALTNMKVEVFEGKTLVKLLVSNDGLASINANTPIQFYHTVPGSNVKTDEVVLPIGIDIFPNEKLLLAYTINGNPTGLFTHCRLVDDGTNFPATGYTDCDLTDNYGFTSVIRAVDDYFAVFRNEESIIDIAANDTLIGNPVLRIIKGPKWGNASITPEGNLSYTPTQDHVHNDTLQYTLRCEFNGDMLTSIDTAYVFFKIMDFPENITDADCFTTPPPSVWSIKQAKSISDTLSNYLPALVGDLDGDKYPDIVTGTYMNQPPYITGWWSAHIGRAIAILKGPDHEVSPVIFETRQPYYPNMPGVMAIGRIRIGSTEKGIIVVAESDKRLRAYDENGIFIWESDAPWTEEAYLLAEISVGFADFNNDGQSEIYTGNRIFNAENGVFLCKGDGNKGLSTHSEINTRSVSSQFTVAADVYGDARLELIAGNQVYEVAQDLSSMTIVRQISPPACIEEPGLNIPNDGWTQITDIDNDGSLDIVVEKWLARKKQFIYIWNPERQEVLAQKLLNNANHIGIPFIGDIDGRKDAQGKRYPEILFISSDYAGDNTQTAPPEYNRLFAFKYNGTSLLQEFWVLNHSDESGLTGLVLFDFNQDTISEIVYRDETHLRIINGSKISHHTGNDTTAVYNLAEYSNRSGTGFEYPVVADVDGDGSAEILITGSYNTYKDVIGHLTIYKSNGSPWAPARKVWNQYGYNAVNVNEDLTIPAYPLNPAMVFAGPDHILGTADDVRPYNGFLLQQTALDKYGMPVWLTPDVVPDESISKTVSSGKAVEITMGIINQGDAVIGSPVYVTLYKESVSATNQIVTGSADSYILPGDTGYVTVIINDIEPYMPMLNIIARVNDDGTSFTYQTECDDSNNEMTILNPVLSLMMKKNASIDNNPDNGRYPNPVSVLYSENIKYEITAVNVNKTTGKVIIKDTLPSYLLYVQGSDNPGGANISIEQGPPAREIITWELNLPSMAEQIVSFSATPASGTCASQPLFINRAWITASDTLHIVTGNSTYHQGAGLSVVTFSAGPGGRLYNADAQAIDYNTTVRDGVLIVPDNGYKFTGWNHDEYVSHRGKIIQAQDNIMHYDTLTILGNVELKANFAVEKYPIRYYLNNSKNHVNNPESYTIHSEEITIEAPQKEGDIFTGWTDENGGTPRLQITLPKGSTGERVLFAHFLHSGSEVSNDLPVNNRNKVWAVANKLYVQTEEAGSIIRIFNMEGILYKQQTIITEGISTISLPGGVYIVTINNGTGHKVSIQ